ncbi:MAG: NUDIX domain-containing protein [Stappiaceae bacterium]
MPEIPICAFIVSIVALRQCDGEWQVLLLKRSQSLVGAWCQVAGKIKEKETGWQAAVRELKEETGLVPDTLYSADFCEQFYEADRDSITMAPVFVAIVGKDANVTLNEEHSDYRWMTFEEAKELVAFGGQRQMLRWIETEFVQREPSKHLLIECA